MITPKLILNLYRTVLYLYPRPFRGEFGEEMVSVFEQVLADNAAMSRAAKLVWLFKEFTHLVYEALRQHLSVPSSGSSWRGSPSRREAGVALIIFIAPISYLVLNSFPGLSDQVVWSFFCAAGISIFAVGLIKGLPRWSLPYLGLVISLLSFVFVFQYLADLASPTLLARLGPAPADDSFLMLFRALWAGLIWLTLLTITTLLLGLLALLRRFRRMLAYLREDWTLVSYILYYGATVIILLIYRQIGRPFTIAIVVCLACGAWLYLHSSTRAQQVLALTGGLSLAMVAAYASWNPAAPPDAWYLLLGSLSQDSMVYLRSGRPIFDWVWMLLILLAPAMLRFTNIEERSSI